MWTQSIGFQFEPGTVLLDFSSVLSVLSVALRVKLRLTPRMEAQAIHLQPERPLKAGADPGHFFCRVCHHGPTDNCCDNAIEKLSSLDPIEFEELQQSAEPRPCKIEF